MSPKSKHFIAIVRHAARFVLAGAAPLDGLVDDPDDGGDRAEHDEEEEEDAQLAEEVDEPVQVVGRLHLKVDFAARLIARVANAPV